MKRINDVINRVVCGDAKEVLRTLPDQCIDCVVTSPPYWSLRDYGVSGQLGLEASFTDYISRLCDIFDEVKRVLRPHGTCWVNLGDTYAHGRQAGPGDSIYGGRSLGGARHPSQQRGIVPTKSLVQIPSRFAIEMSRRGWILRNTIIWHKPACKPESVTDRFTVDFEYLFFFVKNRRYWFRPQYEAMVSRPNDLTRMRAGRREYRGKRNSAHDPRAQNAFVSGGSLGRNKRTVWSISPRGFKGAHFAVFPPALIKTPIRAGCAEIVCIECGSPVWPERRRRRRRSE